MSTDSFFVGNAIFAGGSIPTLTTFVKDSWGEGQLFEILFA